MIADIIFTYMDYINTVRKLGKCIHGRAIYCDILSYVGASNVAAF